MTVEPQLQYITKQEPLQLTIPTLAITMDAVLESPFPAATKQAARIIDGIPTDCTVVSFADKIIITLTQDGRLAQWVPPSFPPLPSFIHLLTLALLQFHVPLDGHHPGLLEGKSPDDEDGLLPLSHLTPTTLLGGTVPEREALGQTIAVQLASVLAMRRKEEGRMLVVGLGLKQKELEGDGFVKIIELVGECL